MTPSVVLVVVAAAVAAVVVLVGAYALGVRSTQDPARLRRARASEQELAATAFAASGTPLLVVAADGRVLHRSEEALRLGLVRGGYLAHGELRHLVAEQPGPGAARRADGGTRTLVLPRGPVGEGHLEVRVSVRRLDPEHLLLEVENRSEAMRLEDVRRDFVVNVSHELKTPVGAISVLAETLEDAADDAGAVRRFAARIRQECARLQVLVTDVLELSRVQVVDGTPRHDEVEMGAVVAQAVAEVRSRAEEHRIELAVSAPAGHVVVGDEDLLVTAVRNLLVNAVAYSPEDTRVSVSVGRRDGLVVVQVTDRGIGIPVQEQTRVFERFYRVDPARSRRTGGTGLGLAIVKHVVDNHGGDVQVWSRPGQGSTFTVRLPDASSDPEPDAPRDPAPAAPPPAPRRTPVTRILVVEDEPSFHEALSYQLGREGYEVTVAETGDEGLAAFERDGADLVLLDLMLPGTPGTEVCRRLRARSRVPIIMLTAKDGEVDKVVGLELGADDYVTKPYSVRELVARIRAVLRRGEEADGTPGALVTAGPVRMDVDRHVVTVEGRTVALPLKEFELLELLVRNPDRVLTRGQIIDRVWGADYVGDTKTLDVHVKRLRSKVEPHPSRPRHIVTVRGLGYKFET